MAGVDTAAENPIPLIDEDDPFKTMNDTLRAIMEAVTNRDPDNVSWDLTGGGAVTQSQHIRFRAELLVFTTTVAAVVTVTIGTVVRTFATMGADTKVVPFVFVIERGTDVTLASNPAGVTGYLIGERE